MGLAFLPWERLPAYVFGPLLIAIGVIAMVSDEKMTAWHLLFALFDVFFGVWMIWYRYAKGVEPLWTEEQREKSRQRKLEDERRNSG
jgi:hypothetical protein